MKEPLSISIVHSENIPHLRTMADNSIDAVVMDGPYGFGFMGKEWDTFKPEYIEEKLSRDKRPARVVASERKSTAAGTYNESLKGNLAFQEFFRQVATELLRVLKPGGHLISCGGPRTYHRMASGVEDAGFQVRDQIQWIFASGFPKSHNLEGEWEGWGSALKPGNEPILLARKPLEKKLTLAKNVQKWGTGCLNIDGCRVEGEPWVWGTQTDLTGGGFGSKRPSEGNVHAHNVKSNPAGRWPANVIHDGSPEVLEYFPEAKGQQAVAKTDGSLQGNQVYGLMKQGTKNPVPRKEVNKSGARFFYAAKPARSERNKGLESFPDKIGGMRSETSGQHITRRDGGDPRPTKNDHPTVKPVSLMRYLVRLVTPSGGIVLDPFNGSGTTGIACKMEGFNYIGIEKYARYVEISKARIEAWEPEPEEKVCPYQLKMF